MDMIAIFCTLYGKHEGPAHCRFMDCSAQVLWKAPANCQWNDTSGANLLVTFNIHLQESSDHITENSRTFKKHPHF